MKTVTISQCSECPHNIGFYEDDVDGHGTIKTHAICEKTSTRLDFLYYSGYRLHTEKAFPSWCPLEDV